MQLNSANLLSSPYSLFTPAAPHTKQDKASNNQTSKSKRNFPCPAKKYLSTSPSFLSLQHLFIRPGNIRYLHVSYSIFFVLLSLLANVLCEESLLCLKVSDSGTSSSLDSHCNTSGISSDGIVNILWILFRRTSHFRSSRRP